MKSLPEIADVRDDLHRIRERTEADVDEEIAEVLSLVERFFDREEDEARALDRLGLLETAEETLLSLETGLDDDAARYAAAARNRLEQLRDAVDTAGEEVVVIETRVTMEEVMVETKIADVEGRAQMHVTVVNVGGPTDVEVTGRVTDADENELTARSTTLPFDAAEQRTVDLDLDVPGGARTYEADVRPR